MDKYFIFENEKEIKQTIEGRLLSNGYSNYIFKEFDKKTENITLMCEECGITILTDLKSVEDGALEKECNSCKEIKRNQKLHHQHEIAEIISENHLKLISIDENNYYIKCEMCGKEYHLNEDFYIDSDPKEMHCDNLSCVLHLLLHGDFCTDTSNAFGIKIIDDNNYCANSFVSDIFRRLECEYGYFKFNLANDGNDKTLCLYHWDEYYNETYHSYENEDYKTGIYDEMNDFVQIICKKCGNSFLVSCEQYHEEDFECRVCEEINKTLDCQLKLLKAEVDKLRLKGIEENSSNKNKCKFLKNICKKIAKENNIVYLSAECPYPDCCCPDCVSYNAEIKYLENELNCKLENKQKISLAFLKDIDLNFSTSSLETQEKVYILMQAYNNYRADLINIEEREKILKMPIDELYLSRRAYYPLRRHGIKFINELTQLTNADLLKVKSLGRKAHFEIICKLALLGLNLDVQSDE